jgi:ribosomal protein S6
MARHKPRGGSQPKEIRAWGIRRREVDINQLALAYYLLARIRIEEQRQSASNAAATDAWAEPPSEAA